MKRFFLFFTLLLTMLFSLTAQEISQKNENRTITWRINTGVSFFPGLTFNEIWDPGYTGTALTCTVSGEIGIFTFETGVEAGYSYTGFNILFPFKTGMIFAGNDKFQFYGTIYVMPGMIMARPYLWFQISMGTVCGLRWQVSRRFSLSIFSGFRFTTSPDYSSAVYNYGLVDLDIGLTAGFLLGK